MVPSARITLPPTICAVIVGIPHALIGGQAQNAWVTPRLTTDFDLTVAANRPSLARVEAQLIAQGLTKVTEHGAHAASGPDFQRFRTRDNSIILEFQTAKTPFQHEMIGRARRTPSGLRVATPDDLIILKLIAERDKDAKDLVLLCALPNLDWAYIERWAVVFAIQERIARYRPPPT
jgi:hypothetical protein